MKTKKSDIKAPCGFPVVSDGEVKTGYPDVNCNHKCDACAWNPKEKKRRLAEGRWGNIAWRTNSETGEIIKVPDGTRKLIFKGVEHGTEIQTVAG